MEECRPATLFGLNSTTALPIIKVLSLHLDLKIIFNLQNGKFLSIVRLSLVLKSSEALPKYGKCKSSRI